MVSPGRGERKAATVLVAKRRMFRAKACIVGIRSLHMWLAIFRNPVCREDMQLPIPARFCETCGENKRTFIFVTSLPIDFAQLLAANPWHINCTIEGLDGREVKMRLFARVAVILILLGCGTAPLLYGKMAAAAGTGQSISTPKFALIINNWSHRVKLSEPGLLLILGLGLVVSSGRLPRFLNSRAYGKRRPTSSAEDQRNLKLVGKKPFSLKAVS